MHDWISLESSFHVEGSVKAVLNTWFFFLNFADMDWIQTFEAYSLKITISLEKLQDACVHVHIGVWHISLGFIVILMDSFVLPEHEKRKKNLFLNKVILLTTKSSCRSSFSKVKWKIFVERCFLSERCHTYNL